MKTYHLAVIAFALGIVIAVLGGIHARLGQLVELGIADMEIQTMERQAELDRKKAELERLDDEVAEWAEKDTTQAQAVSASQAQAIADVATNVLRGRSCPHCGGWVR